MLFAAIIMALGVSLCAQKAFANPIPENTTLPVGESVTFDTDDATFTVTNKSGAARVTLVKVKNAAKTVTIPENLAVATKYTNPITAIDTGAFKGTKTTTVILPATISKINRGAFKGSNVKTLIVKSKKLTKKSVKGSLKGSKVKTVKVKVGSKAQNKKYVKKYKKIFTPKNCGKKVTVK